VTDYLPQLPPDLPQNLRINAEDPRYRAAKKFARENKSRKNSSTPYSRSRRMVSWRSEPQRRRPRPRRQRPRSPIRRRIMTGSASRKNSCSARRARPRRRGKPCRGDRLHLKLFYAVRTSRGHRGIFPKENAKASRIDLLPFTRVEQPSCAMKKCQSFQSQGANERLRNTLI